MITKNNRIEKVEGGVSYEWDTYDAFLEDFKQLKEAEPHYVASHLYFSGGALGMEFISSAQSDNWYGCDGGAYKCMSLVENGWPELRERLAKMMDGIELELPVFPQMDNVRRRKRRWMDQGDTVSMTRVWNGQLDTAWQRPVRINRMQPNTKRISLAFDVSDNANIRNKEAMWRAALCTLLCDSLARAGRVFEIWVIDSTVGPFYSGPHKLWSGWCVKQTQDPLVMDRMAGMVSIGFMRTAGFMAEGMGPYRVTSSLGGSLHYGLPATLRRRQAEGEVVLRIAGCYSKEGAIDEYARAWQEIEAAINGTQEDAA
jgi:hypothetical protein